MIEVFPFTAFVGQEELKSALLLAIVNPAVGGVLLQGPYGVGKTTMVRSVLDLLPPVSRSACPNGYGCTEDEPELQCDDCKERVARGVSLVRDEPVRLIELPLNARMEDVVGGIDERVALEQRRVLLEPGVLATADKNILYVDEINLLDHTIADAILDAAAQGRTFVRRGAMVRLFTSRFVLIGSMNPEAGRLRPQILDRFGLRVWVHPLPASQRLEAVRNVRAFRTNPEGLRQQFANRTTALARVLADARAMLPDIELSDTIEEAAIMLVDRLQIPSHRAETVLLEATRAHAALAARHAATMSDLRAVAALALRHRHLATLEKDTMRVAAEDTAIAEALRGLPTE